MTKIKFKLFGALSVIFSVSWISMLSVFPVDANFGSATEEEELVEILKAKLTQHSPPACMVDKKVFLGLSIYQIIEVNERHGFLTMKLWMYTYYKLNDWLWDPIEYHNATRMQFLSDTFWKPDVGKCCQYHQNKK